VDHWWDRWGIAAGQTTVADGDYSLDRLASDGDDNGPWTDLVRRAAPGLPEVVAGRQVHGTRIAVHQRQTGDGLRIVEGIDGHLTVRPGVLLVVTVADCLPLFLTAPDANAVALLHGGWRGVAGGMVESGIEALETLTGVRPAGMVLHIGVGICGRCYEVGPEVFDALGLEVPPRAAPIDLGRLAADRARRAGVPTVTQSPSCTRHDLRFHSWRRDGVTSGRMVAYAGRPLP